MRCLFAGRNSATIDETNMFLEHTQNSQINAIKWKRVIDRDEKMKKKKKECGLMLLNMIRLILTFQLSCVWENSKSVNQITDMYYIVIIQWLKEWKKKKNLKKNINNFSSFVFGCQLIAFIVLSIIFRNNNNCLIT